MQALDKILDSVNLKYEDLTAAERDTLFQMLRVLDSNQLTVESAQLFIRQLRDDIERELALSKESPQTWMGILALFIPFYGLIKKWYGDQHRVFLEARLKNALLLEAFFIGPKKARQALEQAVSSLSLSQKTKGTV